MRIVNSLPVIAAFAIAVAGAGNLIAGDNAGDYHPRIDPADFQTTIDNPYFPLTPGTMFEYSGKSREGVDKDEVTVTRDTRMVMGVRCVVVSDKVTRDSTTVEESFDWYAQDKDGNVWYFGEDTKEVDRNGKPNREGSWEAGVDGAQPGIVMPARPATGDPYRQEYKKGTAEDMGQIVAVGQNVVVPYGTFSDCIKTKEWSALEGDLEHKWYAKGVGLVRSEAGPGEGPEVLTLVSVTHP